MIGIVTPAKRAWLADICARHGVTLAPETPVDTEQLGDTYFIYVGTEPYGVCASGKDMGYVLYVSTGLLPA